MVLDADIEMEAEEEEEEIAEIDLKRDLDAILIEKGPIPETVDADLILEIKNANQEVQAQEEVLQVNNETVKCYNFNS